MSSSNEWIDRFMDLYFNISYINEAKELKNKNIPNNLYRYRYLGGDNHKSNYVFQEIESNYIHLSSPLNFNDPFDSFAFINLYAKITNSDYIKEKGKEFNVDENTISKIHDIVESLCNQDSIKFFDKIRSCVKICCFSETYTNIPMWNHYANEYKGICIQYNMAVFEKNSAQRLRMFPVKYVKKLLEYTDDFLLSQEFIDIFTMISIHKLEDWRYENEWRYISLLGLPDEDNKLFFPAIDKIYMGYKIDKSHENKLIKVSENNSIELYKMKICATGIKFCKIV